MAIPGSNIRLLRQQMGLTQRALADAAGMDVERFAQILSVSVGVLFADAEIVEAAALRMRQVPLLTPDQLAAWSGPDSLEYPDNQHFLHANVRNVSSDAFALRLTDGANLPMFGPGEDLIFDAKRKPEMGQWVAAQDAAGLVCIGRFRPLAVNLVDGRAGFEVIPLDRLYAPASSASTHLELRGVLVEARKYF
jgi:transcriptional regulator with XRE-family HTH domain